MCTVASADVPSPEDCPHRLRLCRLRLGSGDVGYGFTMYTATEPAAAGQFVGDVDRQSPAERAGLVTGDRVVEVNGENVETNSHHEV